MAATIDVERRRRSADEKRDGEKSAADLRNNRATSATSSSSVTDDITLRNVMPSGLGRLPAGYLGEISVCAKPMPRTGDIYPCAGQYRRL